MSDFLGFGTDKERTQVKIKTSNLLLGFLFQEVIEVKNGYNYEEV